MFVAAIRTGKKPQSKTWNQVYTELASRTIWREFWLVPWCFKTWVWPANYWKGKTLYVWQLTSCWPNIGQSIEQRAGTRLWSKQYLFSIHRGSRGYFPFLCFQCAVYHTLKIVRIWWKKYYTSISNWVMSRGPYWSHLAPYGLTYHHHQLELYPLTLGFPPMGVPILGFLPPALTIKPHPSTHLSQGQV